MSCKATENCFEHQIELAEECGLTYVGTEDGAPQFMGEDSAWGRYTKKYDKQ